MNDQRIDMLMWDHIHLRGEYLVVSSLVRDCIGSSPLTWRIPTPVKGVAEDIRIISTYVENTLFLLLNELKI